MQPVYDLTMLYLQRPEFKNLNPQELVKKYLEIYSEITDVMDYETHKD